MYEGATTISPCPQQGWAHDGDRRLSQCTGVDILKALLDIVKITVDANGSDWKHFWCLVFLETSKGAARRASWFPTWQLLDSSVVPYLPWAKKCQRSGPSTSCSERSMNALGKLYDNCGCLLPKSNSSSWWCGPPKQWFQTACAGLAP